MHDETLLPVALAYLRQDPLHHMDMLQPIARGTARLLRACEQGVLLQETQSRACLLSAKTRQDAHRLLEGLCTASLMALHQPFDIEATAGRFGLHPTMACYQAAWLHNAPPQIPPSPFAVRPITPDMAETVRGLYDHGTTPGYIQGRIRAGEMIGGFLDGELAGFAGLHEEGSMGMLKVLPAYRRRGLAVLLTAHLCAGLMARGLTPFSQFTQDNAASRALHEAMGFAIDTSLMYWLE